MKIIASRKYISRSIISGILILIIISLSFGVRIISDRKSVGSVLAQNNEITVIIDPGHGGIDGGTSANDGTVEKDINLAVALKLRDILNSMGIKTVMTRTDDRSIHDEDKTTIRSQKVSDIKNRLKIIESTPNAIFVSIHQNHYESSKYSGTQVFYSKNNPQSSILAEFIRASVIRNVQPDNKREIKQTGKEIYLLYHSLIPSVMVECGFLSNAEDTRLLNDEQYQREFAFAAALGIADYITNQKER